MITIEAQFPKSSAACTFASLALLSEILTNKVPMIEAKTPTPAITTGSRIGPMLLKASVYATSVDMSRIT